MNLLDAFGYVASLWVLAAYYCFVKGSDDGTLMHWANAFGGPVILITTLLTVGWIPALVLTVLFTIVGWIGVLSGQ